MGSIQVERVIFTGTEIIIYLFIYEVEKKHEMT